MVNCCEAATRQYAGFLTKWVSETHEDSKALSADAERQDLHYVGHKDWRVGEVVENVIHELGYEEGEGQHEGNKSTSNGE